MTLKDVLRQGASWCVIAPISFPSDEGERLKCKRVAPTLVYRGVRSSWGLVAAIGLIAACGNSDPIRGQITGFDVGAGGSDGGLDGDGAMLDGATGPVILVDTATVAVLEGRTATVTVRLSAAPPLDVSVAVVSLDPTVAAVAPATLVFTPSDFATPQAIIIRGADDADLAPNRTTIRLNAVGYAVVSIGVAVSDDDGNALIVDPTMVSVLENQTASFAISLRFEPSAPLTITATTSNSAVVRVRTTTVTFTSANWSMGQPIIIEGVDDIDTEAGQATISVSGPGVTPRTVAVSVIDDDAQALFVTPLLVSIDEGGRGTVQVRLTQEPAAPVSVSAALSRPIATIAPATLMFDSTDFNMPKAFEFSGIDDSNLVDDTATVAVSSAGLSDVQVTLTVVDDDSQAIVVDSTAVTVDEGGQTIIGVRLAGAPVANTTVMIFESNPIVATARPDLLTFSSVDWMTAKPVTIQGTEDPDTIDEQTTIILGSPALADIVVNVAVTDDDQLSIVATPASVMITEGSTVTVGITLSAAPPGVVTIFVDSADVDAVSADLFQVQLDASNFSVPQNVMISGVEDNDAVGELVDVTLSSAGLVDVVVPVTVMDDDDACPAPGGASNPAATFSFFATSIGNGGAAGDFGGLTGADARCQCLADAVGSTRTWRAYLSTAPIPGIGGGLVHARDRIGVGPWFNYSGTMIATDVAGLHASPPPSAMILDEFGNLIPRNDHDILTGSDSMGMALTEIPGAPGSFAPTCDNWTDGTGVGFVWVGHPDREVTGGFWNDAGHGAACDPASFNAAAGSGRLYCFAID